MVRISSAAVLVQIALAGVWAHGADSDAYYYGRRNPLLRSYFRAQCLQANMMTSRAGSLIPAEEALVLERRTDDLINGFLHDVQSRLIGLNYKLRVARLTRAEWLARPLEREQRDVLALKWKRLVMDIAEEAGDLRHALAFPLSDLAVHSRYRAVVPEDAAATGFESPMAFIEDQVRTAEQYIIALFYRPTHTVSVVQLSGDDMLGRLARASAMAKELRKQMEHSWRPSRVGVPSASGG